MSPTPWAYWLFPVARPGRARRAVAATVYVAGFAVVGAAALLRQAGVPAARTIWAEDGRIFYSQALRMSFWSTLFVVHDGYVQLLPRLIAQVARLFPVVDAAPVMSLSGAVCVGGVGCLVFHMAKGHICSAALRGMLVAAMVLLPVANAELLDNAVNAPWWLFFACFWALLWPAPTTTGQVATGLLCFLAAASEPLVALFLPLSVVRALALGRSGGTVEPGGTGGPGVSAAGPRWLAQQVPSAGLVLGLLYQVIAISSSGSTTATGGDGFQGAPQSFAVRVGLGLIGGAKGTNWLLSHERWLAVALGTVLFCALLAVGLALRSAPARAFVLVAIGFSVICFLVPVWIRSVGPVLWASPQVQTASRYQAVPLLLLVSAVLVIGDHFLRRTGSVAAGAHAREPAATPAAVPRRSLVAIALCASLLAPTWVIDFRDQNQRSAGPSWAAQVAGDMAECRDHLHGTSTLAIDPPGWTAVLPCRDLLASHG